MKMSSKRRRTKTEIAEQKRLEEEKKAEIEHKMGKYDELAAKASMHDENANMRAEIEQQVGHLIKLGIVKLDEDGNPHPVESLEEQQRLLRQKQEEDQRAQILGQQMQQQPIPDVDPERQRPNQQLELANPRANARARVTNIP